MALWLSIIAASGWGMACYLFIASVNGHREWVKMYDEAIAIIDQQRKTAAERGDDE